MKKIRESNFELLRCILMFMVVLVHYNASSMGKAFDYVVSGTLNYYLIYFMESLAIIGTNGFVLLTGYFSWKKESISCRKPFGLLLYVIAYNLLFYVLDIVLLRNAFSLSGFISSFIPRNWYITLYVALSLISPFINALIKQLGKKAYISLLVMMFILFSIWPTVLDIAGIRLGIDSSGMNTVALGGASSGYSIVNFVMLYLIGAAISKFDMLKHQIYWDVLAYIVCSVAIFVQQIKLGAGWSYANPIVIISCVAFFNIFRKIRLQSNVINKLSGASLGVFLIHTQYMFTNIIWSKCGIEEACHGSLVGLLLNMLACCSAVYLACSIMDMFCR